MDSVNVISKNVGRDDKQSAYVRNTRFLPQFSCLLDTDETDFITSLRAVLYTGKNALLWDEILGRRSTPPEKKPYVVASIFAAV